VWGLLPEGARAALADRLSGTDLQSLLLDLVRRRVARSSPAMVMRRWGEDRFVAPSAVDPRALARVEARLWDLLPGRFEGVELSPVAPLGTSSVVAGVAQHRVVSTVRGSEVVSDPTTALALEAAARRRASRAPRVDVAACHRTLRAQQFTGPGQSPHFALFALVSTMRDTGSGRAEALMLTDHLTFWHAVLAGLLPEAVARTTFTVFDDATLAERFADTVLPGVLASRAPRAGVAEDPARTQGLGYYAGAAIGLEVEGGVGTLNLGDGGVTGWTAALLGDAKERCVVSALSTERLAALVAGNG
jgi:hypothetical protein